MIKSNTRVFRDKVKAYTLSILDDEDNVHASTPELIAHVVKWFKAYEANYKGVPEKDNFISFLMGLPSCINAEYVTYEQRKLLQEWYEQTDEEADKYDDEAVLYDFNYRVYLAFKELCKKWNVKF